MNGKIVKFYHLSNSCLYQLIQAYHQYVVGSRPALLITKKGALNSHVIKLISFLPMVGGSLWVLRLLPPLKLVTMIYLSNSSWH
jgi:hypothetical protein